MKKRLKKCHLKFCSHKRGVLGVYCSREAPHGLAGGVECIRSSVCCFAILARQTRAAARRLLESCKALTGVWILSELSLKGGRFGYCTAYPRESAYYCTQPNIPSTSHTMS
jgi:hypothetical protein